MTVRSSICVVAAVGFLLAGCTHPDAVSMTAPTPQGDGVRQCAALLGMLTGNVGGLVRKDTSATPNTAAWGDPPVTLRCGGEVLPPDPTASLVFAGGMDWRVRQAGDVVEWLSEARATRVEVRVPLSNKSQENVMSDIGTAVSATIPAIPGASESATASQK